MERVWRQGFYWILILELFSTVATASISGWKSTPTQYHIQTDEGPERSFRYQTYNGQYRREKRLDDGTVLGSYGWVDPTGYLRMTDYIADGKGYRITKTHMEFVGLNSVEATETKKVFVPVKHSSKVALTKLPNFYSATIKRKAVNTTPSPYVDATTGNNAQDGTTYPPPLELESSSSASSSVEGVSASGLDTISALPLIQDHPIPTTSRPVINRNSLPFWARRSQEKAREQEKSVFGGIGAPRNGTYVATYVGPGRLRGGKIAIPIRSVAGREGSDVFGTYTTPLRRPTGFIYKIPNQYHKEETESDGSRQGSFGYVDPFGIRRVIHYNAGHTGFGAARDFKYVGRQY